MNSSCDSALFLKYVKEEADQVDVAKIEAIAAEINKTNTIFNAEVKFDGFRAVLSIQPYTTLQAMVRHSIDYCLSRKKPLFPSKTERGCSFNHFTVSLKYYSHIVNHHAKNTIDFNLLENYLCENLMIKRSYLKKRCRILQDDHGFTQTMATAEC